MKHSIFIFFLLVISNDVLAQSFNEDKIAFSNFLKRMYTTAPFEGVKIVDDYDHQYLVSVVSMEKANYNTEAIMNRVAQVRAQSQASTFLNGATISMDMIITTKETIDSTKTIKTSVETIEHIKQNSMGFSQGLELLTNFDRTENNQMVFIYFRRLKRD